MSVQGSRRVAEALFALLADRDISGALFPRGKVEELGDPPGVGLLWNPEPSTATLIGCGLLGLLACVGVELSSDLPSAADTVTTYCHLAHRARIASGGL